jgi:protein required for attachment to host cells
MQFPQGTTIAVTDGSKLHVYRNIGDDIHLKLALLPPALLHIEGKGGGRRHQFSAADPDRSRLEEEAFSASVASWLNSQVLAGHIHKLYVVAPPRVLGELRRHYHPKLLEQLLGELHKEHVHDTAEELHAALVKA